MIEMKSKGLKILNPSAAQVIGGEKEYDGFTLRAGGQIGYWTMSYCGQTLRTERKYDKYIRKASNRDRKLKLSMGSLLGHKGYG